jgi:hypothetical protein
VQPRKYDDEEEDEEDNNFNVDDSKHGVLNVMKDSPLENLLITPIVPAVAKFRKV